MIAVLEIDVLYKLIKTRTGHLQGLYSLHFYCVYNLNGISTLCVCAYLHVCVSVGVNLNIENVVPVIFFNTIIHIKYFNCLIRQ